ncbi:MAG: sulfatase [Acidobacteria bacterium]|nr:sulfatase [Acidobacteriota bacterium]MDA1236680.1 sulfatase [Acidobacteriota bacterium]
MTSSLDRRTFLKNSGLALGAASLAACASANPKPNILWIIGEDFSPELGCYGDTSVSTPNLDRLAAEGVRYTQACVTAPICSIARSALMTGRYQTAIGCHNHRSHRVDGYKLPEGVGIFTDLFREAGYHTANLRNSPVGGTGKTDFNFNLDQQPFDGEDWAERAEGQPFYAQINFSETHRAFKPHPKAIDPAAVDLPPYYPDHPAVRKDWAMYLEDTQHLDDNVGKVLQRLEDEGLTDDTIIIFFGDHGRAMPRGKQFLYEGGLVIPLIVRVPEKFRPEDWAPGSTSDALISHIDITATSLALCGIERPADYDAQVFIGPASAAPRTVQFAARDRADETVDRIRAARTSEWKYIRNYYPERPYTQPNHYKDTSYPSLQVLRQWKAEGKLTAAQQPFMADTRPPEELYDLKADPYELHNLAADEAQLAALDDMRTQLDGWIAATHDTGATPENPLPVEYDLRTHVDGWMTANGVLSRQGGRLHMQWSGNANVVRVPWVAEGGKFELRLRMRSPDKTPEFFWATVDNMLGQGNRMEMEATANNSWNDVRLSFEVPAENWLCLMGLDFGSGDGSAEIERASLYRAGKLVRAWEFA